MPDITHLDIYSSVTLVDRATGETAIPEFLYDGIPFVFRDDDGQRVFEKIVPQFIGEWLFAKEKERVWTADGQYTHRYGLKAPPKALLALVGPEAADCSPIVLDHEAVEGSDAPIGRVGPVRVERVAQDPRVFRAQQGRSARLTPTPAGR